MSVLNLVVLGYVRFNILREKNKSPQNEIISLIGIFTKENDNYLVMFMGSINKLYHNIATLNTSTFISKQIKLNNFAYNEIICNSSYCKLKIPKNSIPKWLINTNSNSNVIQLTNKHYIYNDDLIGIICIGGNNKTQNIGNTKCSLFVSDNLNIINNDYNNMYHIALPALHEKDGLLSISSIVVNKQLICIGGENKFNDDIDTVKILNLDKNNMNELKWQRPKLEWNKARSDLNLCAIPKKDKIFFLGGQYQCIYTGLVDLFDINNSKIIKLKAMNYSRLRCKSLFDNILNERVIVVGGFGGSSFERDPKNSSKSMEIYDCNKNIWILNNKLTNYEHENCCLWKDKNNPNILMIAGNHPDPTFYNRENDGYIEYIDLRDPFPSYKWSLLSEKSLIQMFNIHDDTINSLHWRCNNITAI